MLVWELRLVTRVMFEVEMDVEDDTGEKNVD